MPKLQDIYCKRYDNMIAIDYSSYYCRLISYLICVCSKYLVASMYIFRSNISDIIIFTFHCTVKMFYITHTHQIYVCIYTSVYAWNNYIKYIE